MMVQGTDDARGSEQIMKLMLIDIGKTRLCGPKEPGEFVVQLPGEHAIP